MAPAVMNKYENRMLPSFMCFGCQMVPNHTTPLNLPSLSPTPTSALSQTFSPIPVIHPPLEVGWGVVKCESQVWNIDVCFAYY